MSIEYFFLASNNLINFLVFMKFYKKELSPNLNKRELITDISILISIVCLMFVILELKHPFYFLSDDNRTFYLPLFTHNYRAIASGELAFFNFHQYLGIAHFSNFQSAIFYPLTYFSMFLSKISSGHEFWTIDIAVLFHFIIGSIGFYKLLLFFTKDRYSALFGGLIWVLNSFNIFVSNSWWIFSGVTAYLPWMLIFAFKLYREGNIKNVFLLILFRLLLFYVGHIEYFIYCMIFEFLTVTFLILSLNTTKIDYAFFKKYLFSYPITFIYTLPILIPAWIQTSSSAFRNNNLNFTSLHYYSFTFSSWIKGLLNPFAINNDFYQLNQYSLSKSSFPFLSHIGYIPVLLVMCFIILSLNRKSFKYLIFTKVTFFITFLISFLWSFGLLAGLIYYLPILNRFRWPFKLYAFSNFYLILISSFGFYALLKYFKLKKKKQVLLSYLLIVICLLNFYLLYINVYISFNYRAHTDLIPIEEPFYENLKKGRIFSLGISEDDPFSVKTLGFNYATLLGLNHFAGYDPLIPMKSYKTSLKIKYRASYKKTSIPINYLRSWGVKWYIVNKDQNQNVLSDHYFNVLSADSNFVVFADEQKRTIFYDKQSIPLIHWQKSQTSENIEVRMRTNSIHIQTNNSQDDLLIINYLYNDFFKATLNDKKIAPINETSIGQMKVFVPKGENNIEIKYKNPYYKYGIIIVIIFSLLLGIFCFYKKHSSLLVKKFK